MTEAIEAKEQGIIQRIRASGLPSAREVLLIDELLEIRKERRKLVSRLQDETLVLREMVEKWERRSAEADRLANIRENELARKLDEIAIRRNEDMEKARREMRDENERIITRANLERHEELSALRSDYESKLAKMAKQIEELESNQKSSDLSNAKLIANKLLKKISGELEEKFEKKTKEYRDSLLQVAEREKVLEEMLNAKNEEVDRLRSKVKLLLESLNSSQSRMETAFVREKDLEKKMAVLLKENEDLRETCDQRTQELDTLTTSHEQSLKSVDEKVRKMLENKDREIGVLKTQVVALRREKGELERIFAELNNDLKSVRRSTTS